MSSFLYSGYCIDCTYKDDAVALGEGFLKGDDANFSPLLRAVVQRTGITHLAAASGANLALVSMLVPIGHHTWQLFFRLIIVALYGEWLGWGGSLWRAWLFWLYQWSAKAWGRPGNSWRMVIICFLATAVFTPQILADTSAQLSFLAWLGLFFSRYIMPGENNCRINGNCADFFFSKKKSFLQGWVVMWFVSLILWWRWGVFQPLGVLTTLVIDPFVPWYFAISGLRWVSTQAPLAFLLRIVSAIQSSLYRIWWIGLCAWDFFANQDPMTHAIINAVVVVSGTILLAVNLREKWQRRCRWQQWSGVQWVGG